MENEIKQQAADLRNAPLADKMKLLLFIERTRGKEAAVQMMPALGLPDLGLPTGKVEEMTEGEKCLAHILTTKIEHDVPCYVIIKTAIQSQRQDYRSISSFGLMPQWEPEPGMLIADDYRCVERLFAGTRWEDGFHSSLNHLREVSRTGTLYQFENISSETVFVPMDCMKRVLKLYWKTNLV